MKAISPKFQQKFKQASKEEAKKTQENASEAKSFHKKMIDIRIEYLLNKTLTLKNKSQ